MPDCAHSRAAAPEPGSATDASHAAAHLPRIAAPGIHFGIGSSVRPLIIARLLPADNVETFMEHVERGIVSLSAGTIEHSRAARQSHNADRSRSHRRCSGLRLLQRMSSKQGVHMYNRILVPVDGSVTSEAGLTEAIRLARLSGGALRLLHVIEDVPYVGEAAAYGQWPSERTQAAIDRGQELLRQCATRVADQGVQVDTLLIEAGSHRLEHYVNEQIQSWPAEIVVLGTHGRRGAQRLILGSDAEQILRVSEVPVMLVRHDGKSDGEQGTSDSVEVAIR
jgi:nucleotide-binding universal stress UspA family protein